MRLLLLSLMFVAMPAFSSEVFLGITAQQSTLFISDDNTQDDLAEMEDKLSIIPALSARSENKYFSDESDWGYFLEFNIGYYNVNRQVVNGNAVNLKTRLSGLSFDLTPTIYYNFGSKKREEWAFKAGLGIGAGYLSVSGNVILTGQVGQPLLDYNDHAYGFTVGVFFEAVKNHLFFQIKGYGPDAVIGGNDIQLANIKMTIGKTFIF